jgi:carboxypeptidase Taq
MKQYNALAEHFDKIADFQHLGAICGWDEAAMMPAGGGESRARALARLQVLIHDLVTDDQVPGLLLDAAGESLNAWQQANLREINRAVVSASAVPSAIVEQLGLATARCEQAWRIHRANNDWSAMQPLLQTVVDISRERAAILANEFGCSPYDALLDEYEPGVTSAMVDRVFADLKTFLPDFAQRVINQQSAEPVLALTGNFSVEKQKALGMEVMTALGFDFAHGRLDISHHPFCGGVPDDVRITTRYNTDNFVESLMGVIHETGHAMYEQGLPAEWRRQPVGQALSSGTHESQSLLMEMQAGRTREFLQFLAPRAQRAFLGGESNDPAWSVDNLHRVYTRVQRSYIRVDADEVTYPLHVILRYELEKDLISGDLKVKDIPEAWDAKMREYLDISTAGNFTDGCLQDVHWPAGLFGYFPTYTLGAMTAAQLFAAATREVDDLHGAISRGDFSRLLAWLREKVHSQGKFLSFDALMIGATGETLDAKYFKQHLTQRYLQAK